MAREKTTPADAPVEIDAESLRRAEDALTRFVNDHRSALEMGQALSTYKAIWTQRESIRRDILTLTDQVTDLRGQVSTLEGQRTQIEAEVRKLEGIRESVRKSLAAVQAQVG